MGELFRQIRPGNSFPFTGERMVPGLTGAIEAEHLHRYFLARALCRGKDVLDVASGEGYGSAFLAQTSRSVIGVELDSESVEYARSVYSLANLQFVVGDATRIPIDDRSVDIVVSFETIEHIFDHEKFLHEVKRVLRPEGLCVVSTPDKAVYSAPGTTPNPFHVRELTEVEFRDILSAVFHNVSVVRQRSFAGSAIVSDTVADDANAVLFFEQRGAQTFEADLRFLRAPFLLAFASDHTLPALGMSLYIHGDCGAIAPEIMSEIERLRSVESKFREQRLTEAATIPALQSEFDRLRKVEDLIRQRAPTMAQAMSDAATVQALQAELERLRKVEAMAREQNQVIAKAHEEHVRLAEERDRAQDQLAAVQAQLDSSLSMARQQCLTAQRSMLELLAVRQDLDHYKAACQEAINLQQDLDQYKAAYQEAINLLIPWRLRQAVPKSLKWPLWAIKRAVRSLTRGMP